MSRATVSRSVPGAAAVKVSDNETYALIQTPPVKEMIDVTKLIGWSFVNNTFFLQHPLLPRLHPRGQQRVMHSGAAYIPRKIIFWA